MVQRSRLAISAPITNDDNAKFKLENENMTIYFRKRRLHEYGNADVRSWSLRFCPRGGC